MIRLAIAAALALGGLAGTGVAAERAELERALAAIRSVKARGEGNAEASAAWKQLSQAQARDLPALLVGMDGASPLAVNWIRAAVETVVDRELRQGGKLPSGELNRILADRSHHPRARRLAYELLIQTDPSAAERLLPTMLDDPSLELRRDAVARVLEGAAKLPAEQQSDEFLKALAAARDLDQVQAAADALKKAGKPVDLARHFGFVQRWKLIGPFDNRNKQGYAAAYPPESKLDAAENHQGKAGTVNWFEHTTTDAMGNVDLNKAIGKQMGVVAYAWADFESPAARDVELRAGSFNAVKVWLNGQLLAAAEVYHTNAQIDQYVGRGKLRAGKNSILVKVCQNEQTEPWAQNWHFYLRVCDHLGTAVLAADRDAAAPSSASR